MSAHHRQNPQEPTVLAEAVRGTRRSLGAIALFSFCLNILILASPLYMLQVFDRVLSSGRVETLIMLTVMLALALACWAILESLRSEIAVGIALWFSRVLQPHYIGSSVRARLAGSPYGEQAFRDLTHLQSFVGASGLNAFFDAPWTPIFIIIIWMFHPLLGMLALFSAVALLALTFANDHLTRGPFAVSHEHQMMGQQVAEGTVRNAETVSALGMVPAMVARVARLTTPGDAAMMVGARRSGVIMGFAKFLRMFFQSTILGLGAYLVIRNQATPGIMIAASILLGRALAPIDQALGAWKSFVSARAAYDRLREHAEAFPPPPPRMRVSRPRGQLEIREVSCVVGDRLVLDDISFDIEEGEAVAIIGPSAAGKSTLCKVIVGLIRPDAGLVRLDGIDLSLWDRDEIGPLIGYLPQDVGLFAGTVRENIARMQDAPVEQVLEAARLAHAHDMIIRLPEGYETVIGDGGAGLSGGQRQRLGLARAVFRTPPLIVLDEPNANLDQAGEAALAEAIIELKQRGSTLIIVGHRPSTLAQADKVLLLAEGAVQGFGPTAEILEKLHDGPRVAAGGPSGEEPGEEEEDVPPSGASLTQLKASGAGR